MIRLKFPPYLLAGLAALSLASVAMAETHPFSYKDLVRLQRLSDMSVSPKGDVAVFTVRKLNADETKGVMSIWWKDLKDITKPEVKLAASEGGASSAKFSPDGQGLYFISSRSGSDQIWRTDLTGVVATQVTDLPLDVQAYKIAPDGKSLIVALAVFPEGAAAENGGDEIAYTLKVMKDRKADKSAGIVYDKLFVRHWDTWADGTRNHLFRVDLDAAGKGAKPIALTAGFDGDTISKPSGDEGEFTISPDSKTLYLSARPAGKSEPWSTNFEIYAQNLKTPGALVNLTPDNPAWDAGPRVSPDGTTLAYKAMKVPGYESDRFWLYLKDLKTGKVTPLAEAWDRSVDTLEWSKDGKSLLVTAYDIGVNRLFRIDVKTGQVMPITHGGHIDGFGESAYGMVFAKSGLNGPSQLYLQGKDRSTMVDATAKPLTKINDAAMSAVKLGAYEQFSFKGWNNETVYGFVVKPSNYEEGKTYPIAFIVHGGPHASFADAWSYRWNPQTYAGEGFGVVFIDFHATDGYGQAFADAINNHWGDRPLEDLQKGYAYALEHYKFLDGKRACALGASYGGYMINWMAGKWKEPWKCLVNHDGIFDTRSFAQSTEELWFPELEYGGTPYADAAKMDEFNPALLAKDWSVPMLVVMGDKDYRIVPGQGIATFTALQRQGIESKFLRFPDENHWVLKPQNSLKWHETVIGWLKHHTDK